jgi:hypothetical protein
MDKFNRNGFWMGVVSLLLLFSVGCATGQMENSSEGGDFFEAAKVNLARLPAEVIRDSNDTLLRKDNFTALLLAGGASIAMHNSDADKNIAENIENHQAFSGFWDESLNIVGSPGTHFALTGLWYAISVENEDYINKERAWTMIRALSVTGMTTVALKAIRNNDTPNGKPWAWPSGHTSSSFTVASVLDEFYGPKVGIPAYIGASLVAYRMLDAGDHWGSDIVFGATLGWVVGHTIAGQHKQPEIAGFNVLPYSGGTGEDRGFGVLLMKRF